MGADVVIATPGRLITHISLGNVDLSKVSFFILDEADRMLDMGFSEDINTIATQVAEDLPDHHVLGHHAREDRGTGQDSAQESCRD